MKMDDDSSGYFQKDGLFSSVEMSDIELIYSGESSSSEIYTVVKGLKRFTLKCLKPQYKDDPFYIGQLKKEFEIGYLLDHPNIARYYSFEEAEDKGYCIIREWVDGTSLYNFIKDYQPSKTDILRLLEELCDALVYLHKHQTVHRDLKPSNILVTHDGAHIKIIDFGFSDSRVIAGMKLSGGTLEFASPEQKGEIDSPVGYKSDIYSLGKIIEKLPFKKSHKLRNLTKRLLREKPSKRPELIEIKKVLKNAGSNSNLLLWGFVFIVALICLISFLVLNYKENYKEEPSEIIPVETISFDNIEEEKETDIINNSYESPEKKKVLPLESKSTIKESVLNEEIKTDENSIDKSVKPTTEPQTADKESVPVKRESVHPLVVISYNYSIATSREYYKLYPDSIKDWERATKEKVTKWIKEQSQDSEVEAECLEAMKIGIQHFKEQNSKVGSN